jgi:hypothetical protein
MAIEQAVAKQVPVPDQAELIRQFNARQFADKVRITRDNVVSEGVFTYESTLRNMNFGSGSYCRIMTRKTWSEKDWQGAMVFFVNGRAYGYAAICGNLFELTPITAAKEFTAPVLVQEYPAEPVLGLPETPSVFETPPEVDTIPQESFAAPPIFMSAPIYGGGLYYVCAPVPELPIWVYLIVGSVLSVRYRKAYK